MLERELERELKRDNSKSIHLEMQEPYSVGRCLKPLSLNTFTGIIITGGYGEEPELSRTSAEILLSVEVCIILDQGEGQLTR